MPATSNSDDTLAPLYLKEHGMVGLPSRHGRLRPLKTCLETQALNQTVEAHVVEIPTRSANTILRALQEEIPEQDAVSLQHLRRFAKPGFLPDQLRVLSLPTTKDGEDENANENNSTSVDQVSHAVTSSSERETTPEPSLHLLVCAASTIPSTDLTSILSTLRPLSESQTIPSVRTIPVPLLPPTSDEQARLWSRQYWPTVYKRNNPFGPHPSLVSRAEAEIRPQVDGYMALATRVGREVHSLSLGESIGAVIVDRKAGVEPVVLAVAGDGRKCDGAGRSLKTEKGSGNVMAHAVMRAIGMIARKRREVADSLLRQSSAPGSLEKTASEIPNDDVFADRPFCDLEMTYYTHSPIAPHGYLCLDLEIYVSHEPCVMCSMAINHSRFGRVVFGKRMPRSGGLTSEMQVTTASSPSKSVEDWGRIDEGRSELGLGYGLFWRPGLNWKLLAWEWIDEHGAEADEVGEDVHV